jgi:4-amino-4-deoxy-L-arabinose transferase-like glycosyltransferase
MSLQTQERPGQRLVSPLTTHHSALTHHNSRPISILIQALLLAYCAFLFLYGLGKGELYRTESLRAIIAAEFLRSGNWIVPTLYGEPLFTKPPGMYAAIALASWPLGEVTEWTARFPSAAAATIAVFLTYWYFRRTLGTQGGLLAAFILPASFMWLDKASAAEIDMLQAAWVTAAILFFLRGLENAEAKDAQGGSTGNRQPAVAYSAVSIRYSVRGAPYSLRSAPISGRSSPFLWWLAALVCVAGGVLTKWTAPAFFYLTVVPLLWWRGRLRWLFSRAHILAAAAGAGVCLAWLVAAIRHAGWHPLYDTVSREALMRLLPSHYYRPYPWHETLLHPVKVLVTNLPWSVCALLALRPGFGRSYEGGARRLLQALHCWTWPSLCFWTLIPEHAIRHSFPLFPGIAGLSAFVWLGWIRGEAIGSGFFGERWLYFPWCRPIWKPPALPFTLLLALWLLIKLAFVHLVIPARNVNREPRAKGQLLARLVPEGQVLYLFRLKDEGIMFYYQRPVRRLPDPTCLPSTLKPLYCILDRSEWRGWKPNRPAEALQELTDEQGAPIVLVKLPSLANDR